MQRTLAERFWAKVDRSGECWPFLGSKHSPEKPYGQFYHGSTKTRAHRMAFYLTHDRWPDPCCLHSCDNHWCVRPEHLHEGTVADNNREKSERHKNWSILTEQDILAIHEALATGEQQKLIAARFNCTPGNICLIASGKSWRRLHPSNRVQTAS